ncbi:SMP-30/gluconolactonase/LRE family protein [Microbacterium sp. BK668]|uniref:SMP-30/gluconolactonase/LRE family protein n=1 Tax=Microbacterium sp. BK668 TaxID=2512118 RepID=UPI00105F634A|nr:SMP-30/gluconolactonase/LRE family protein [Microbacterium sp. BK668]TDN91630.1 sugar lactone lactonase YvrE [Microbacterium sp. BK668]
MYDDTPSLGTALAATTTSHFLAEGPLWDPVGERVLWVDIMAGAVHTGRLEADDSITALERIDFPDTAGTVALSARGDLVVAGRHGLHYRDAAGAITSGRTLIEGDGRRFNDGKADPAGRLVVGTKGPGGEVLLRVDAGESVTVLDDDLTLSNGLAWTADGRRLYSVDTMTRRIFVRDYDAATGAVGERRLFIELEQGHPDGMTIDAHDHLWVAVWGGGCVLRIAPSGRIVSRVEVPAPHTSCPAFAGPGLDVLVITTATENLPAEERAAFPASGSLFTIRPGVAGLPTNFWSGIR